MTKVKSFGQPPQKREYIRVFSFQAKEVINELLKSGKYIFKNKSIPRQREDKTIHYQKRLNLKDTFPIYTFYRVGCFYPLDIKTLYNCWEEFNLFYGLSKCDYLIELSLPTDFGCFGKIDAADNHTFLKERPKEIIGDNIEFVIPYLDMKYVKEIYYINREYDKYIRPVLCKNYDVLARHMTYISDDYKSVPTVYGEPIIENASRLNDRDRLDYLLQFIPDYDMFSSAPYLTDIIEEHNDLFLEKDYLTSILDMIDTDSLKQDFRDYRNTKSISQELVRYCSTFEVKLNSPIYRGDSVYPSMVKVGEIFKFYNHVTSWTFDKNIAESFTNPNCAPDWYFDEDEWGMPYDYPFPVNDNLVGVVFTLKAETIKGAITSDFVDIKRDTEYLSKDEKEIIVGETEFKVISVEEKEGKLYIELTPIERVMLNDK